MDCPVHCHLALGHLLLAMNRKVAVRAGWNIWIFETPASGEMSRKCYVPATATPQARLQQRPLYLLFMQAVVGYSLIVRTDFAGANASVEYCRTRHASINISSSARSSRSWSSSWFLLLGVEAGLTLR